MEARKTAKKYPPDVRARAVRMVGEHRGEHAAQWAISSIAAKIRLQRRDGSRGWVHALKAARPNALLGSDFTYVATRAGFVYVAFVLDALEQALHERVCSGRRAWCITATAACSTCRSNTPKD